MPNWAEGTLKIRGTRAEIKKFLLEGLQPIPGIHGEIAAMYGKEVEPPKVEIKEDEYDFTMKAENGFHIIGTRRAFIEGKIDWEFNDKHTEILTLDFKQAWVVESKPFAEISKQYNVDIKIYVFESGMQFNQDIEIHKGQVIKDNAIKFDDYEWECIFPNIGG